jgi:hypothetical protein
VVSRDQNESNEAEGKNEEGKYHLNRIAISKTG